MGDVYMTSGGSQKYQTIQDYYDYLIKKCLDIKDVNELYEKTMGFYEWQKTWPSVNVSGINKTTGESYNYTLYKYKNLYKVYGNNNLPFNMTLIHHNINKNLDIKEIIYKYIFEIVSSMYNKNLNDCEAIGYILRSMRSFISFGQEDILRQNLKKNSISDFIVDDYNNNYDVRYKVDIVVNYKHKGFYIWSFKDSVGGFANATAKLCGEHKGEIKNGFNIFCPWNEDNDYSLEIPELTKELFENSYKYEVSIKTKPISYVNCNNKTYLLFNIAMLRHDKEIKKEILSLVNNNEGHNTLFIGYYDNFYESYYKEKEQVSNITWDNYKNKCSIQEIVLEDDRDCRVIEVDTSEVEKDFSNVQLLNKIYFIIYNKNDKYFLDTSFFAKQGSNSKVGNQSISILFPFGLSSDMKTIKDLDETTIKISMDNLLSKYFNYLIHIYSEFDKNITIKSDTTNNEFKIYDEDKLNGFNEEPFKSGGIVYESTTPGMKIHLINQWEKTINYCQL